MFFFLNEVKVFLLVYVVNSKPQWSLGHKKRPIEQPSIQRPEDLKTS